jgi:hypothetical protein
VTDTVIVTETNTVLSVTGNEPQVIVADPQVQTVAVSSTDTVLAVQDASTSLAVSDLTDVVTVVQETFQTVEIVTQGPQGPPGSGGTWGSITGTLSAQTDLQSALNLKADASALSAYALAARLVSAGTGLSGGGSLAADRTLSFDTAWGDARYALTSALGGYVPTARTLSTTAPLAGGGDLSANRTLSINANGISDALLRQGAATSVIGRSAGTIGNVADIAATADGQFFRRVAGALTWSALAAADVTGALGYTPVNRAGDTMSGALDILTAAATPLRARGAVGAAPAGWDAGQLFSISNQSTAGGDTRLLMFGQNGADAYVRVGLSGAGPANAGLRVVTGNVDRLLIDVGGRLGLGSMSPSNWYGNDALAVFARDANSETMLGIQNATSGASASASIRQVTATANSFLINRLRDNAGSPFHEFGWGAGVLHALFSFNGVEAMRLTASGNLVNFVNTPTAGGTPLVLNTRSIATGAGLTGGGNLSADRTLSVVDDSTTQRIRASLGGSLVGTRREINFIQGANTTLTVADDSGNNRVNVTIAATGGGGGTPGGSSGQVQWNNASAFAGIANVTTNGTDFTAVGLAGNLTFSGAARRIRGDFSNMANYNDRVCFQTSVVNDNTNVYFLPNGTATAAGVSFAGASTITAGMKVGQFVLLPGTAMLWDSLLFGVSTGFGDGEPHRWRVQNNANGVLTGMSLFPSGNLNVGPATTDPGQRLNVDGNLSFAGASRRFIIGSANDGTATLFQGSTLNSSTIFGAIANGTSTVTGIRAYGDSTGTNTVFTQIAIDGANGFASLDSSHNGAGGSSLPLRFRMTASGSVLTRATLFNNGNFNIGGTLTDPGVMFRVEGSVRFNPAGGTLVGVNVPSSSWMNTTSGFEFARAGNAIVSYNSGPAVQVTSNTFFNGTSWVYANTGVAGVLNVNGGTLDWLNAPSGTGGTNLTLTSRFSVNASGNAVIGAPTGGNALSLFAGTLFSPGANPTGAALRVQGSFGGGIVIEDTAFWGMWADGSGANLRIGSSPNNTTGFTTQATLTNTGNFTTPNHFATGAVGFRHTDGGTGAFFELRARDAGGGYRPTGLYVSNDGTAAGLRFDFAPGGNLVAWPQSNFLGFEAISGTSGVPAVTLHKSGNYAARMYLNSSNRFSFGSYSASEDVFQIDFGGTTFLRSTGPTHWWWDTDHRTFGIHVNSNLAYFMRGGVNDPNWTTVTDRYGNLRWPAVLDLNTGNWEMGNDLRTGGKFFGRYAGNGLAAVILSTAGPSGGADGDLWLRW